MRWRGFFKALGSLTATFSSAETFSSDRRSGAHCDQHRQKNSPMTQYSHHTAPTQFVEAKGIRFAYAKRLGITCT
jgi:hypothetical protein